MTLEVGIVLITHVSKKPPISTVSQTVIHANEGRWTITLKEKVVRRGSRWWNRHEFGIPRRIREVRIANSLTSLNLSIHTWWKYSESYGWSPLCIYHGVTNIISVSHWLERHCRAEKSEAWKQVDPHCSLLSTMSRSLALGSCSGPESPSHGKWTAGPHELQAIDKTLGESFSCRCRTIITTKPSF